MFAGASVVPSSEASRAVPQPTFGPEHEDPRHRHEQAGNGECQQRERMKDRCAGSVRALHDPGDRRPHQQCQDGARAGKDQRIAQQAGDVPARIGFGEILERESSRSEAGILGEGVVDERRHGHEYQPDGDRNAGDEHQIC
jgi:hypothetical protein